MRESPGGLNPAGEAPTLEGTTASQTHTPLRPHLLRHPLGHTGTRSLTRITRTRATHSPSRTTPKETPPPPWGVSPPSPAAPTQLPPHCPRHRRAAPFQVGYAEGAPTLPSCLALCAPCPLASDPVGSTAPPSYWTPPNAPDRGPGSQAPKSTPSQHSLGVHSSQEGGQ